MSLVRSLESSGGLRKILVGGALFLILKLSTRQLRRFLTAAAKAKRAQRSNPTPATSTEAPSHAALVAAALQSPKLVGVHDKAGWTNLFTRNAVIEDPVGSPPSGPDSTERSLFYDTFIGPNNVTLNPTDRDLVAREQRIVVRRVSIDAQFSNGATMRVPVHVVYRFDEHLKATSLMAHWEVVQNMPVLNSWTDIFPALIGSTKIFVHIFLTRGISYTMWYLAGTMALGAGGAEKRVVRKLFQEVGAENGSRVASLFAAGGQVSLPVQNRFIAPAELLRVLQGQETLVSGLRAGGEHVSCNLEFHRGGATSTGVAVFEFQDNKIKTLEIFAEAL